MNGKLLYYSPGNGNPGYALRPARGYVYGILASIPVWAVIAWLIFR